MADFWSELPETKRAYRWEVYINDIHRWLAKSVSKPGFSVSEISHRFINHTFWYPGRVEWNQISVSLVDPASPDAAATVMSMIEASGYVPPYERFDRWPTMNKSSAVTALKGVTIKQIDKDGFPIETWTLKNPWIKDVSFGDLSYDNDDLMSVTLTLRYDWAYLKTAKAGMSVTTLGPTKRFPSSWTGI